MNHRLLTSAAAMIGLNTAASTGAPAASAPAPAPAPVAAGDGEATVDVVTLADAQAAAATARTEGATAERERTNAVLNSDAGKANPATAAFLLNTSPSASADQIIGHMASLPAPAAAAPAPAPVAETPPITNPLDQTPRMDVAPNASKDGGDDVEDHDKIWSTAQASVNAARPMINPGLPRTGN